MLSLIHIKLSISKNAKGHFSLLLHEHMRFKEGISVLNAGQYTFFKYTNIETATKSFLGNLLDNFKLLFVIWHKRYYIYVIN